MNHAVGTVLHSFILVPYHMWRMSHRHHHKNTANYEKDEIFYPVPDGTQTPELARKYYFGLGLAWVAYLFVGYWPRPVSHFNVFNPMFRGEPASLCLSFSVKRNSPLPFPRIPFHILLVS